MKPTQLRGAAFAAFHAGEWFAEYRHARRDAKETEGEARRTHIKCALRCRRRYREWLRQAINTQRMLRVEPTAYDGEASRDCLAAVASTWRMPDGSFVFKRPADYAPAFES